MTQWGVDLIRATAGACLGPYDFIGNSDVESLRKSWSRRSAQSAILFADCPELPIVEMMLRKVPPLLLFAEEPVDIVAQAMVERQLDLPGSIALANQCLAVLHDLFSQRGALIVSRSHRSVSEVLRQIASHFGLALDSDRERAILPAMGLSGAETLAYAVATHSPLARQTTVRAGELTSAEREMADAVVSSLYARLPAQEVEWPVAMFRRAGGQGVRADERIDLVGGARHLIYGPYLHLPRGAWTARVTIATGDNASGNDLYADVVIGEVVYHGDAALREDGSFSFDVPIVVHDARTAIEVRLGLKSGAIEGWLELKRVTMTRAEVAQQ